jgi:hypothetical protein
MTGIEHDGGDDRCLEPTSVPKGIRIELLGS